MCGCSDCIYKEDDIEVEKQPKGEKTLVGQCKLAQLEASTNVTRTVRIEAWLNFCKTWWVCIVLTLGSMSFSTNANDLALAPIERMIEKVNAIAKNPISAKL